MCSLSGALSARQLSRNIHGWFFEISVPSPHLAPRLWRGRAVSLLPSGSFRRKKTHTCALWPTNQMLLAPSHSRALSPRKRERGGAARMSSSLGLTMSVSGPQNRRLFCGTCWRWGESRVTLGLGHARASCPGSPGMGRDPAFSGKGSTAGLTTATSHHLPPGVTLPTNFSCKRQGCDRTRKTNRRRVRPRHSDSGQLRGPEAGDAGAHSPGSCWVAHG